MIDREARNRLLQGIDDYMDEKISAKEFDDLLHKQIVPHTKEQSSNKVAEFVFLKTGFFVILPLSPLVSWKNHAT